jgi:predicted metal-dependent peptidase
MSAQLQQNLTKICKDLMLEQPFYGLLLLNLNKEWTNKVPTAGVGLEGINYKLYINPEFWQSLSEEHKKGLLQHELMHIAFFHITEYKHLKNHELANVAQDIEINQKIDPSYLPPDGCTLEKFIDKGYDLLPEEGTNIYYEKLNREGDGQGPGSGKGNGQGQGQGQSLLDAIKDAVANGSMQVSGQGSSNMRVPDHQWDDFDDLSETQQKLVDKQLEVMLDEVVEQVQKMRGTIPREVLQKLEALKKIEPPKFNWKAYLRRYIGNSSKNSMRKTKRKQSKRFELDFGIKVQEFSNILIAIDSSASVSDDEIKEFMNEIHHMYKCGHDFTLIFADTQMQDPIKYRPSIPLVIKKRGGTDFNPVVDYYMQHRKKYTTLIYLTDGECPAPTAPVKSMLWVLSTRCQDTNHLPGKTIKLN